MCLSNVNLLLICMPIYFYVVEGGIRDYDLGTFVGILWWEGNFEVKKSYYWG